MRVTQLRSEHNRRRVCRVGCAARDKHQDNMHLEQLKLDPLGSWSAIRVSGDDRVVFLQGQLTRDIRKVTPQAPALTGWANNKGRLLCTGWVITWANALWLLLPAERRAAVAQRLKMFVLRSAVEISTPDTPVWLAEKTEAYTDDNSVSDCFYDDYSYVFFPLGADAPGLLLGQRPESVQPDTTRDDSGTERRWRAALIRAGVPTIYDATAEYYIPQMVNLDLLNGISFDKGCYVGQEIVARTHNLGRIKRRMFAFSCRSDSAAHAGSEVYAGEDLAGTVVDGLVQGDAEHLLAVIKLDKLAHELHLHSPDGPALTAAEMPYLIPERL